MLPDDNKKLCINSLKTAQVKKNVRKEITFCITDMVVLENINDILLLMHDI